MLERQRFSLEDKYRLEAGKILLSGIQALVRLPLDQHRADQKCGLNTATFISGYRGSPLGGLDLALHHAQSLLKQQQVVFVPGVNEDLGATAVFGSQLANLLPQPKYDGVLGMWYGKAPGVDRCGDVFKHANFTGVGRYGGVLAVAGDDPIAKSSTLPSHSEAAFFDAQMPVLYPGNVQDVLDLGRLGFELSRYSGCWVGLKIVTDVADSFGSAEVSPERILIRDPGFVYQGQPWQPTQNPALLAPQSLLLEQELYAGRLEAAKFFAATNNLNRITANSADAWIGIVSAGKSYYDVCEALQKLGLDEPALAHYGIRLLKLGLLYPLEPSIVRQFARGLTEIIVVEEKRAFIELFLRDILYNCAEHPRIVGKRDDQERRFIHPDGELDPDEIAALLARRLAQRLPPEAINNAGRAEPEMPLLPTIELAPRTPYFCSGCPHNRSTVTPAGSLVGGGIGCHTMTFLVEDRHPIGITQMGGEGAQWVGQAPFTGVPHIFQNLGDGTLFHSGSLAIRQAVDAGVNLTYKILYNSAVAMTGGQPAEGAMSVPTLTRALQAEGVRRIIVVSNAVDKYPHNAQWADQVEVWPRDELDRAQQVLRDTPGVTVLIYDQECAAELRRQRKRGKAPEPPRRIFINEAVCEGCGDCGEKSNCLSVFPVETEFGRKTQIHQSSCNKDYSCLQGDCPAFVSVIPGQQAGAHHKLPRLDLIPQDQALPEPRWQVGVPYNIYMMGIGGTGVVTVNQILSTAAFLDGHRLCGLDQTGLSQKGGPVVSNLKLLGQARAVSNKVTSSAADLYLVFDLLSGTTDKNLSRADKDKTVAVVSTSQIPTGAMIRSTQAKFPPRAWYKPLLEAHTQSIHNLYLDAVGLAEHLFASDMPANLLIIGAAYQAGYLPIHADAIVEAIRLNGVDVEVNQLAFRVGRLAVADPAWIASLKVARSGAMPIQPIPTPQVQALLAGLNEQGELGRLLAIRVPELIDYQDKAYACQYVEFVKQVYATEQRIMPGQTQLSEAVARYLFKLMAYKDEYEVARLYLKPAFKQALNDQFGADAQIHYQLHPPFLRALGLQRKIAVGAWFGGIFRLLAALKWMRSTWLDPFGYTHIRRTERALIHEYRARMEEALRNLSAKTYDQAVELAKLPDRLRGYETVKLNYVARYWSAPDEQSSPPAVQAQSVACAHPQLAKSEHK